MSQESSPPTGRHESSKSIGGLKDRSHVKKHVARLLVCTLRRSTPAHRHRVAKVARNLCSQKFSGSSFARSATAFRLSRKLSFGLHSEVGNTRLQLLFAFAFHALRLFTSLGGIGISRSLYAFGVLPLSGLWVTRTIDPARFKRGDERWEFNREGDPPCTTTIDACHKHRIASHSHGAKRITLVAALHQSR